MKAADHEMQAGSLPEGLAGGEVDAVNYFGVTEPLLLGGNKALWRQAPSLTLAACSVRAVLE